MVTVGIKQHLSLFPSPYESCHQIVNDTVT